MALNTVTQATSKSTAVSINTTAGQITMNAAALADAANVSFVVTNRKVNTGDTISVNHISGGTSGGYGVSAHTIVDSTSFKIRVMNNSGGSLSEALVLQYKIQKAGSLN